jgi:hypothetical protein
VPEGREGFSVFRPVVVQIIDHRGGGLSLIPELRRRALKVRHANSGPQQSRDVFYGNGHFDAICKSKDLFLAKHQENSFLEAHGVNLHCQIDANLLFALPPGMRSV